VREVRSHPFFAGITRVFSLFYGLKKHPESINKNAGNEILPQIYGKLNNCASIQ